MNGRYARLAAVGVLALAAAVLPIPPASAHTDACTGVFSITITPGLHYPGIAGAVVGGTLSFSFITGVCAAGGGSVSGGGPISGPAGGAYCGSFTGVGAVNGHAYSFVVTGSTLEFSPVNGGSTWGTLGIASAGCTTPNGARTFMSSGWILTI